MTVLLSIFLITIICAFTIVVSVIHDCRGRLKKAYDDGFSDGVEAGKKKALRRAKRHNYDLYITLRKLLII